MLLAAPVRRTTSTKNAEAGVSSRRRTAERQARDQRRLHPDGEPRQRAARVPQEECTAEEAILRQLFLMNLCSVAGYRELADLTEDAELRTFADVVARQRSAQAREIGAHFGWPSYAPFDTEPAAAELRLLWLKGLWALDEGEECHFAENLEEAEVLLEDAYLRARQLLANGPLAPLFDQHSISVCGVRQRIEELVEAACGCDPDADCDCSASH